MFSRSSAKAKRPANTLTLEGLYDAHATFVWRSLRGMGVPEASVEDAVQEVFLVVHRRLPDYEARGSVRSWLFAIALRVARDQRRSVRRRPTVSLEEEGGGALSLAGDTPFDHVARTQELAFVERFLDQVNEAQRAVFVLGEIQQLRAPEIAELLEENVNTVYSRLRAVRQAFARALAEHPDLGRARGRVEHG